MKNLRTPRSQEHPSTPFEEDNDLEWLPYALEYLVLSLFAVFCAYMIIWYLG
jgi:hypothetical protein